MIRYDVFLKWKLYDLQSAELQNVIREIKEKSETPSMAEAALPEKCYRYPGINENTILPSFDPGYQSDDYNNYINDEVWRMPDLNL